MKDSPPDQCTVRAANQARFIMASPYTNVRMSRSWRRVATITNNQKGAMIAHWMKTPRSVSGSSRSSRISGTTMRTPRRGPQIPWKSW